MRHTPHISLLRFCSFLALSKSTTILLCATLLGGVLLLSGCAQVLKPEAPVPHFILIPKVDFSAQQLPQLEASISIARPTIPTSMDSDRIGLIKPNREVQFYGGARWFTTIPQLFQTLVVRTFESAYALQGVTTDEVNVRTRYHLSWDIREFHAIYSEETARPDITIAINAWLIDTKTDKLLGNKSFQFSSTATGVKLEEIVLSFENTVTPVLTDLVVWTIQRIAQHTEKKASTL